MSKFVELHILQEVSVNALNCDDRGRPKTVTLNNDSRGRFSSQALTRDVKEAMFEKYQNEHFLDKNSRRHKNEIKEEVAKKLEVSPEVASHITDKIWGAIFGKAIVISMLAKYEIDWLTEQIINNFNDEILKIKKIYDNYDGSSKKDLNDKIKKITGLEDFKKKEKEIKKEANKTFKGGVLSASFGRMMASNSNLKIEASINRGHAITTHVINTNDNIDYFVAIDDIFKDGETGSGHIDNKHFVTGCYYKNFIFDISQLLDDSHLGAITSLYPSFDVNDYIKTLISLFINSLPNGKNATFSSKSYPCCVIANVLETQPVSLANAFNTPVKNDVNCTQNSIEKMALLNKENEENTRGYDSTLIWTSRLFQHPQSYAEEKGVCKNIPSLVDNLMSELDI